jgi:hypothetical protein
MKKIAVLVMAMALLVAGLTYAQAKPDFSGKWAPKVDANAAPPAGGGGGGRGGMMGGGPMTVKQTATELTTERTMGETVMASTYKLDGSESVNKSQRGESKSTAKWDGAKLVIKTVAEGPNGPNETTQTWSLTGGELSITTTSARGDRTMTYTKG